MQATAQPSSPLRDSPVLQQYQNVRRQRLISRLQPLFPSLPLLGSRIQKPPPILCLFLLRRSGPTSSSLPGQFISSNLHLLRCAPNPSLLNFLANPYLASHDSALQTAIDAPPSAFKF